MRRLSVVSMQKLDSLLSLSPISAQGGALGRASWQRDRMSRLDAACSYRTRLHSFRKWLVRALRSLPRCARCSAKFSSALCPSAGGRARPLTLPRRWATAVSRRCASLVISPVSDSARSRRLQISHRSFGGEPAGSNPHVIGVASDRTDSAQSLAGPRHAFSGLSSVLN